MPAPYESGDFVVFLDDIPNSIRVIATQVRSVSAEGPNVWRVTTDYGEHRVNAEGRGGGLWPTDEVIERKFIERGNGFWLAPEPQGLLVIESEPESDEIANPSEQPTAREAEPDRSEANQGQAEVPHPSGGKKGR